MKSVLYTSPYVPGEWIAAHGCEPVRVRPQGLPLHPSLARAQGLCPFAQAWASDALSSDLADAIVMTTCCDQMRRVHEVVTTRTDLPCFLLDLPHVWGTDSAFLRYQDELRRLGRFLEGLASSAPSEERLSCYLINAREPIEHGHDQVPLALVGSHGLVQDEDVKALIEQQGGRVVLDTTEPAMPQFKAGASAFNSLCEAYWEIMEDVFQRPNTRLYSRLKRLLEGPSVKGIVLRRYVWCDLWHAEVARVKAWSPVPVLDVEIGSPNQADSQRLTTRIQAFMEMIR